MIFNIQMQFKPTALVPYFRGYVQFGDYRTYISGATRRQFEDMAVAQTIEFYQLGPMQKSSKIGYMLTSRMGKMLVY